MLPKVITGVWHWRDWILVRKCFDRFCLYIGKGNIKLIYRQSKAKHWTRKLPFNLKKLFFTNPKKKISEFLHSAILTHKHYQYVSLLFSGKDQEDCGIFLSLVGNWKMKRVFQDRKIKSKNFPLELHSFCILYRKCKEREGKFPSLHVPLPFWLGGRGMGLGGGGGRLASDST